jgi:hypothetical protein
VDAEREDGKHSDDKTKEMSWEGASVGEKAEAIPTSRENCNEWGFR